MTKRIDSMLPYDLETLNQLVGSIIPTITSAAASKYPPHNIVAVDESTVAVELAVAGFAKDEISITVEENTLRITGNKRTIPGAKETQYIHKGIATRPFVFTTRLLEGSKVSSAKITDGILTVAVAVLKPEKKSQSVNID